MRSKKAIRGPLPFTALAALLLSAACSGNTPADGNGSAGFTSTPSGAGSGVGGSGSSPVPGAGGATIVGAGGTSASAASGAGGILPGSTSGAGGLSAAAGGSGPLTLPMPTNSDHCLRGYDPLPSDNTMAAGPVVFMDNGKPDTTFQPEILAWMSENKWTGAHVIWHAVRGCTDGSAAGLLNPLGYPNICKDYPILIPTDQNCKTGGDGYQFLLFHRHMLQTLAQLWPKHAADFAGFPKWPTKKEELPNGWNTSDPTWSQKVLDAAAIGDNIEANLAKFPDEGALGYWLQCPNGGANPSFAPNIPYVGLHFDLHNQWARTPGTLHGLNNGQVNVTNYMFWKLHGWIDKVWEKYRVAKGLTTDAAKMQKYTQDLKQSCNEMDIEEAILKQTPGSGPKLDCPADVNEGKASDPIDFHTKVRPIFESATNNCASCHGPSQTSPWVDLTLGGQVSSKCIVDRLTRPSRDGGQFQVVMPGDPEHSYLYLKAAGLAATAGCVSSDPTKPCNTASMPPGGMKTVTDTELKLIYDWIKAGAKPSPTTSKANPG